MLIPNQNPQGDKEPAIYFIAFAFVEFVNIIYWLAKMNIYVSNIDKSYKDTIIGNIVNSGTEYLLLHIVQYCRACTCNK